MKIVLITLLGIHACLSADSKFEQDREAILSLAGNFKVDFHFQESLAIREGYELKKPYKASAHEMVKVVENTDNQITLQHLLVVKMKDKEARVIKHWAQTWKYEDQKILTFKSKRKWITKKLTKEKAKGTWSQFVTQIDDSPRYECFGTWEHKGDRSIWVSSKTNRPLPRREYSKRKDYDILVSTNTNVVTKTGWAHEQHNAKLVKRENSPEEFIAHEIGTNTYTRVGDYNFKPAIDYWKKYASYWAQVRLAWGDIYSAHPNLHLERYVGNDELREMIYELVETTQEKGDKKIPKMKEKITEYIIK